MSRFDDKTILKQIETDLGPEVAERYKRDIATSKIIIREIEKALGTFDSDQFNMEILWAAGKKRKEEDGSIYIDPKNPFMCSYAEALETVTDIIRRKKNEEST